MTSAIHPPCPRCKSVWKYRNKHGLVCRKCFTVYDDFGNEIVKPKPPEKGNVAGKIEIGRGSRWMTSLRRNTNAHG